VSIRQALCIAKTQNGDEIGESGLSLLQARDVCVSVFPERREFLIGGADFGGIALWGVTQAADS